MKVVPAASAVGMPPCGGMTAGRDSFRPSMTASL